MGPPTYFFMFLVWILVTFGLGSCFEMLYFDLIHGLEVCLNPPPNMGVFYQKTKVSEITFLNLRGVLELQVLVDEH